jgi:hypothetical protein
MPWSHMSPIVGHPMQADFDCSPLGFGAKFAVVGDFDGDGQAEIAVAPVVPGSAGNDFWVMKFDSKSCGWRHLSPIPDHPMGADFDCSGLGFPAKFAVAGRFDATQHPATGLILEEIAVAPLAGGTVGNDFWVMKFDLGAGVWNHMSPIAGHQMEADFDCSGLGFPAKFAVAGDFDGDGLTEIAVAPDAPGSRGNDFWVMKFDPGAGVWNHMSPIAGHQMEADFDCSGLGFPAKFAVAGDFDGDGPAKIAVAPDAPGSRGNDFWEMGFFPVSPELDATFDGTAILRIAFPQTPDPFIQHVVIGLHFDKCRQAITVTSFPPIPVTFKIPQGTATTTVTLSGVASGTFDRTSGSLFMPIKLRFSYSLNGFPAGFDFVEFNLTTGASTSPGGAFTVTGSTLNAATGAIAVVGTSRFPPGFPLKGSDCSLVLDGASPGTSPGTISPIP